MNNFQVARKAADSKWVPAQMKQLQDLLKADLALGEGCCVLVMGGRKLTTLITLLSSLLCQAFLVLIVSQAVEGQSAGLQTDRESSISTPPPISQAASMIRLHKIEAAESILSLWLRKNPNDATALDELGFVRLEQKRPVDAQALFEQACNADENYSRARVHLGQTEFTLGFNERALEAFESVLARQPKDTEARAGEVQTAIASALEAKKNQDVDGALVYLARGKHWVPDDPTLLMDFSIQADSMRIYKQADLAIHTALQMKPDDRQILYTLARIELDERKMPEAERDLRKYLTFCPEDASAHYGLGHLLHMLRRDYEARAELEQALKIQPRQTESYYEMGELQIEQRAYADARASFQKVLEFNPNHAGALVGMGIVAFDDKDYPEAEQDLKTAIAVSPDSATAHRYYAKVLLRLGRETEAQRENDEADRLIKQETNEKDGFQMLSRLQ